MSGIFDQIINYSPPLIVSGTVNYKGTWNASTNNPPLSNPPVASTKGDYYVVSTAGTQFSISFAVGDWIISSGTAWEKVDLTDAVSSVFGRTGAVVGVSTDYSAVGLTNTAIGASSPSTGAFTTVTASSTIAATGTVTGSNLSGTNTGDQTTISGNAGSATILQTARNINGVSFNGSADITVTAAAGTLTGATLASGVTASSLTSLGTIASLVATTADINGGTIDGTALGATAPSTVAATTGTFSGKVSIDGAASTYQLNVRRAGGGGQLSINIDGTTGPTIDRAIQYYAIGDATNVSSGHVFYARNNNATDVQAANISSTGLNSTAIGATTPSTGAFTTLSATRGSAGVVATLLSGNAAQSPFISLGRASEDSRITIAAAGNDGLSGTVAGDIAIGSNTNIWLGTAGDGRVKISSTGLAVTGALSATGAISGQDLRQANDGFLTYDSGNVGSKSLTVRDGAGNTRAVFSSTGLAVTGTLSSTTGANFATSSGSVGVGTTTPLCKTEVYDSAVLGAFVPATRSTWRVLQVKNFQRTNSGSAAGISFQGDNANGDTGSAGIVGINDNTTGGVMSLAFLTASANVSIERARIDSSGNVGIGTTSPASRLHILGAGTSSPILQLTTTGTGNREFRYVISGPGADYDTLFIQGNTASGGTTFATRVAINANGNVGIGTDNPGSKLDVNGELRIGNTVNTVSPTSPNRTVTIVIGGTTYYLAAKTTND